MKEKRIEKNNIVIFYNVTTSTRYGNVLGCVIEARAYTTNKLVNKPIFLDSTIWELIRQDTVKECEK